MSSLASIDTDAAHAELPSMPSNPGEPDPSSPPGKRALFRAGAPLLLLLIAVHATGVFGTLTYSIIILVGTVLGVTGIIINRPAVRWPWAAFVVAAMLWAAANAFGGDNTNLGDLTRSRSLLPDFIALPGYALFGAALYGLLRLRRRKRDLSVLLDGVVLALGAAFAVHHTLIVPTLGLDDTWLPARLIVTAYPVFSLFLVGIATQLAFSPGRRSPSLFLVLAGTAGLVVGDVVWAFGEVGQFNVPAEFLEFPYLMVPVCIGLAMAHPGITEIGIDDPNGTVKPVSRYVAVASALIAPAALVLFPGSITPLSVVLSIALCLASAMRVVIAMRAEDVLRATLLYRATHDDLTNLPSRPLLLDAIDDRLAQNDNSTVALLFIDLDKFKNVNDLMGHQAGDELLVTAAARIAETVREGDLVARISGDEFVVLSTGLTLEGARRIADRIRITLARPFILTLGEVALTASVGVSVAEHGAKHSGAELLQQADTAMYESKIARNETTVFDTSMHERSIRRMEIERLLRHSGRSPELTVHFQPIIESTQNAVLGFEALLRWDALGAAVSPAEFIPIAEESGMIVPIGAFVLDEACRQAAFWRSNIPGGENLYVSVNVSPRQLCSGGIVDTVAESLDRHGLPASALWLEITETAMTEDTAATAAALSGIRMLGVKLALDDFGTGYSSLSGLQFIPVNRLKIDRQFVAGMGSKSANDKLVRCIAAVAESFDLDVVAEGVETVDQLERLREFGCTQIQGYLFSPAVEACDVPEVFKRLHEPQLVARRHRPMRSR